MVMPRTYEGGCLCGHIRFAAEGPPLKPHTCSCKMCQRHSGAVTLHWVEFPAEKVTWTGPGGRPSVWRSSDYSSRSFCPTCGSTLGAIDDKPVVALVLGSFDSNNRRELAPNSHSFAAKTPKWARTPG
jgi:hypothetical protein